MVSLVRESNNEVVGDQEYHHLIKIFSKNIKLLRNKRGLTQEDMTNFGFNYRHYQKLESGAYSPNLYTLHRLAKFFRVKVSDLLD